MATHCGMGVLEPGDAEERMQVRGSGSSSSRALQQVYNPEGTQCACDVECKQCWRCRHGRNEGLYFRNASIFSKEPVASRIIVVVVVAAAGLSEINPSRSCESTVACMQSSRAAISALALHAWYLPHMIEKRK